VKDRTRLAILGALVGLLVALGATGLFIARSARLEEAASLAHNDALARAMAAAIQAREEGYQHILSSYAGRFRFREAVARRDRAEALVHLRQIAESFPELDRPFLADPAGVIWAIHPDVPGLVGRSSTDRDWYRGIRRDWRPYMSEVFQVVPPDPSLIVALVVPIRAEAGHVIGILGSGQRLETIRRWLSPVEIEGGNLYVVDRKGQFVFHPARTGPERLRDFAQVPIVQRLLQGEEGTAETLNPVEGEVRLTAYRWIPSLGWGLVVQRSKNFAVGRVRTLMLVSAGAGLVLALTLGGLAAVALRNQRETSRTLAALEEKSRALGQAQEELVRKERLAVLGQLAGGVGHELRNPLGVIKNSVFYLRMVLPEDRRVQRHLQILEREVASANRIIGDLLDFARLRVPARAAIPLNGVVWDVLDRMPPADNVKVVLALADDLPPVAVDPEQMKQVLGNLVLNASQAMPEGGTLRIETGREDEGVFVAVSDTGVGIPAENLDRIFQPLFTTKAKGIGLGLAMSSSLVEANGGAIGVESTPGRGSRFTVRVPAAPAKE
jgi:signal transduction histidine kinase